MKFAKVAICVLLGLPALARAEDSFYLKDGDRVVFYGDSITDQRLYTTFVETFVVTRFPQMDVTFVHSGWGGDRVTGGGGGPIDVRLDRDVFAYKPTVVTIMLGMNDASYQPFKQEIYDVFVRGYRHIVERLQEEAPGIRLTLIRPSPFDDVTREPKFEGGYNAVLERYGDFVAELAKESHVDLADLNTSVVAATKKAYERDPEAAQKLNPDRVHPGPGGQLLMAAALLEAWNAPATVTRVQIQADCEAPKAETANAKISELSCKDGITSWTQKDEALPFPIDLKDPIVVLAVESSDVMKSLDQEVLDVDGLE